MPRGNATWDTEARWLAARNGTTPSERIPGYAAVRVVSIDNTTGLVTVAKPNADNQKVYFVGPGDMATGGDGLLTRDWPAWALYDTADGAPAAGQEWGVAADGFKLRSGKTGYRIVGGAADGRVLVDDPESSLVQFVRVYEATQYNGYQFGWWVDYDPATHVEQTGDLCWIRNLSGTVILPNPNPPTAPYPALRRGEWAGMLTFRLLEGGTPAAASIRAARLIMTGTRVTTIPIGSPWVNYHKVTSWDLDRDTGGFFDPAFPNRFIAPENHLFVGTTIYLRTAGSMPAGGHISVRLWNEIFDQIAEQSFITRATPASTPFAAITVSGLLRYGGQIFVEVSQDVVSFIEVTAPSNFWIRA